jgi:hypothetical protein
VASRSLLRWQGTELPKLTQVEQAHAAIGGTGTGRRTTTDQINDAYILLLAGLFQRYCRDLHTEAATRIAIAAGPAIGPVIANALTSNRYLDRGNPNPSNLNSDFGRLGMSLWDDIDKLDRRNVRRRSRLAQLLIWRNAVAHQAFPLRAADAIAVSGTRRTLDWVRVWRSACESLAEQMDRAVFTYLLGLLGTAPW